MCVTRSDVVMADLKLVVAAVVGGVVFFVHESGGAVAAAALTCWWLASTPLKRKELGRIQRGYCNKLHLPLSPPLEASGANNWATTGPSIRHFVTHAMNSQIPKSVSTSAPRPDPIHPRLSFSSSMFPSALPPPSVAIMVSLVWSGRGQGG